MGGMKREERGNFPEKNFWEDIGLEAIDFSEKNFFWDQKIQNCERPQLRLAPPALGGGVPLPTRKTANLPQISLYKRTK